VKKLHKDNYPNPWVTVKSKIIYENDWIKVQDDTVKTPAGTDGIYGVVQFKNRAVGVVPYEAGYIWLVGQTRYVLDEYSWEIPAGGCPENENLMECAHRELQEETGISADNLEPLLQMHLSNSICDEWGIIYLATDLKHGQTMHEQTEDISVRKVSLDTFYEAVESGHITDSLSVAACYKLMLMKHTGQL